MNVLILGSGGREHAFTWKLAQSKVVTKVFVAPGNPGTASVAQNLAISAEDFPAIEKAILENDIKLVVVGPEAPLVLGVRDFITSTPSISHVKVVGPDKIGAQLEGSKDFSKNFMQKYGIPTASSRTFTTEELEEGIAYVKAHTLPVVLKADGLAAGKGVIIAETHKEAEETIIDMLANQRFGKASAKVVIEQFLTGIELSVFILTDGKNYVTLPEAKDYKRIGEGDTGLNTGGMGAVSPVPFADEAFMKVIDETITKPTINGLIEEGINYVGFIFLGLINTPDGPYVIEYNARMGDPETEVVIPRIKSDLGELLWAAGNGELAGKTIEVDPRTATTVMLVSGGYPGDYEKGFEITGADNQSDVLVFHAGTAIKDNKLVNTGGRVIACTAYGNSIPDALAKSNLAAASINWSGKNYRKDIGLDLLK
jgi:phosphoribosylamine--glycine ligase